MLQARIRKLKIAVLTRIVDRLGNRADRLIARTGKAVHRTDHYSRIRARLLWQVYHD